MDRLSQYLKTNYDTTTEVLHLCNKAIEKKAESVRAAQEYTRYKMATEAAEEFFKWDGGKKKMKRRTLKRKIFI
jgi:hypothetical protein